MASKSLGRISTRAKSTKRRSDCPVACTLDLVGDRWTLLVVRDLVLGKTTFDEFLASPEGIATNILADRLALLQRLGFLERKADPEDGRRRRYVLTSKGAVLPPLVRALARWGEKNLPGTRTFGPID